MKKLTSILLSLALLMSLCTQATFAAVPETDLVDEFVANVYEMDVDQREMFVDLLMLLVNVDDPTGLTDAYAAAFNNLAPAQQDRLESFGATVDAVSVLADFVNDAEFSEDNLRSYLGIDGDEDQQAFRDALAPREDELRAALEDVVGTEGVDKLDDGFTNMSVIFSFMDYGVFEGMFNADAAYGTLTVDEDVVLALIEVANLLLGDDISSSDEVIAGLTELANYYNNADSADKTLIYDYLDAYSIVTTATTPPGGGGGGGWIDPPVEEPGTEPTNVQDQLEEQSAVQVEAEIEVNEDNKTVATVEVDENVVYEALDSALAALEKVQADNEGEDLTIKPTIVIEVANAAEADVTNVQLPLDVLQSVIEANDAQIAIKSDIGVISFTPEAILGNTAIAAGDTLAVAMEKIDPATIKNSDVPEDAVIVDFTIKVNDTVISSFAKPIKVKVPYTLKEGENPDNVTVYLLNDDGTITACGGIYNKETGMVTFFTGHFSKYFAKLSQRSFQDISESFWGYKYISNFSSKGFISGYVDGSFIPQREITRAEFVAIVTKMYGLNSTEASLPFNDVQKDAWYTDAISSAYNAGVIAGTSATTFAPNSNITRQEAAVIVCNILEYFGYQVKGNAETLDSVFKDADNIASWAGESVASAYAKNIFVGKPGDLFDPKGNLTRAEGATSLYKLYNI